LLIFSKEKIEKDKIIFERKVFRYLTKSQNLVEVRIVGMEAEKTSG
jgi:hypothetical protein